ncbi:MAG: efflux transporter periplasmic adaptor subunit [endosymbiont of Galathealinum brachiosum]|uniref:Efflux transporter periplasmic adaptor subunit n=1 Tax=endosymbiont of Galathealinum brachiosum TaxID=2200906 RepID=A0A370DI39_9GAMM|nr:MAG: efflux transporter periplasmic adaptor subunit [endosymbiont of Galathealinum brachiosum]
MLSKGIPLISHSFISITRTLWLTCFCFTLIACSDSSSQRPSRKAPVHLIETVSASIQTIAVKQTITGTLQAIRKVRIINQVPGLLTALPAYPGDIIKKGQLLVQLEDSLLKAEVEKAEATLNQAKVDYRRLKDLAPRKLASESEVAQAQTLNDIAVANLRLKQTELSHSRIKAPLSGIISERLVEPGDVIPLHNHLLTLIDTSSLKAEINLSELLLPLIEVGNQVDITIDALGEQSFNGKIKRIHPIINKDTRRGTVEVILNPVPDGAIAGQFCRVSIHTMSRSRLMIPYTAVRHDKQGAYVYAFTQNRAKRINITTGIQQDESIEVLDGLIDKQQIISKGFFGLKDDMSVKIISNKS